MHQRWLGELYEWAGEYRQVNLGKDGFAFAAAHRIGALMDEFQRGALARYTPCRSVGEEAVHALAETHVELILIHPFREGNGRIARTLSILMALQAKLPLLDFTPITGRRRPAYFAAVQQGLNRDYRLMERLFGEIIDRSLGAT